MFEKVLHPTDFSDCSMRALKYVLGLKKAGTNELILLHVVDQRSVRYCEAVGLSLLRKLETDAGNRLESLRRKLEDENLKVRTEILIGIPSVEIPKFAEKERVSLIVMGSHGKTMTQEILMGSVSENVIRRSRIPILVVTYKTAQNVV